MQVTLDGLKDTHNAIKYTEGCDDVFSRVIDNVELLLRTSDIHVSFRVNLTKSNAPEFVDLYKYLYKRLEPYHKQFGICPAFVGNRGDCNLAPEEVKAFFTSEETTRFVLDLCNEHGIVSQYFNYPAPFFNECAIRNVMSVSFDPEGYAYKCWEVIGNRDHAMGRLNSDGMLIEIDDVVHNRHLHGADPLEDSACAKCSYLPICNGGCPIQRIQNTFEGRKQCTCTHYKGHVADFLKTHIRLRKAGAAVSDQRS